MKRGIESRKAQFYLIAAVIIVFILISFAVVSNYLYVKKQPQKFYDVGEMINVEGFKSIQGLVSSGDNVNSGTKEFLGVLAQYLNDYPGQNFEIIIIYGSADAGDLEAVRYSTKSSTGGVSLSLGATSLNLDSVGKIKREQLEVVRGGDFVNITLIGQEKNITQQFPVLQDNNFVFMMTTSDGFNQYVQSSLTPQTPGE